MTDDNALLRLAEELLANSQLDVSARYTVLTGRAISPQMLAAVPIRADQLTRLPPKLIMLKGRRA